MKVFLLKDVEKVGLAGELLRVADGFAQNFLFPRKLAVKITAENENFYATKIKKVDQRKEVIASATSMLAEKIKSTAIIIKRKMHDDDKLYGSIAPGEVVDALAAKGISVKKSQIQFEKSIKSKGTYEIIIELSSRLKPKVTLKVVPE